MRDSNDCKQSLVMSSMVSVSRCSWTWWRTTQPVCGSWSWQRMTSVRSCSSRSVTCCLKERMMKTERLCPSSQALPPVTSCCLLETSIIQSETSTSPPPGSPTVVRAEHPPPLPHLSGQLVSSTLWLPKPDHNTSLASFSSVSYWVSQFCLSYWFHSTAASAGSASPVYFSGLWVHLVMLVPLVMWTVLVLLSHFSWIMLHLCQPGSAPVVPV